MNTNSYLKELFDFLSIPSISAQSSHKKDINSAAVWLQKKFTRLGFDSEVLPTEGHPVVYAENLKAGNKKATALIYGHYDVQSPDPLDQWITDPFKPEIRSGNIYARGAADDKGQLYTWIAAIEELLKNTSVSREVHSQGGILPVNVKFIIEGEEEIGSKNLDEFIERNRAILSANVCALSDTHCLTESQPLIDYGLRGIVYTQVKVKTLGRDVHSGIYGGNVLNPINIVANLIAKLKDDDQNILIPGFYDSVRVLNKEERVQLNKVPFTDKEIIKETGAEVVAGEKDFSVNERAGTRPTLDVNGIWGGYTNEGPKTIIPSSAHAKISMRIVPNQKADNVYVQFENYLQSIVPNGVELTIELLSTAESVLFETKSKYFKAAEKAYEKVFGNKPIYELSGGTIGAAAAIKNTLGIDCVLMGYGLPDDGLHSPNEKLSIFMFEKGIKTNIEFLKNI